MTIELRKVDGFKLPKYTEIVFCSKCHKALLAKKQPPDVAKLLDSIAWHEKPRLVLHLDGQRYCLTCLPKNKPLVGGEDRRKKPDSQDTSNSYENAVRCYEEDR